MGDDQALKRQFLVRAKALSEQPEVFRCVAVTQLIGETVAFGVRAEAEVFQAVYGDPRGRKYWEAHLSEAIPAARLAHLLAVHLAENAERLSVWKSAILLAIRDAAEAGERWFTGETAPQLAVNYDPTNFEGIYKVKIHPRSAVEWLLSKPKREHLIPESLRQYLQRYTITDANAVPGRSTFSPRKRGPKPTKLAQVKAAIMRDIRQSRLTADKLRELLEKDLAATYGVSRDTARRARNEVMSQIA
jgi:Bacterial regulatory proteins, gntR family